MSDFRKLTNEEFNEIEDLVNKAVTSSSKKTAKPYLSRLDFMQRTIPLIGNVRNIFGELVSSTEAATGQVQQKDHWLTVVNQYLYKLKDYGTP